MGHGDADHGFAGRGIALVVLRQPPISAQPGERPFDDPALGQHDESHDGDPEYDDDLRGDGDGSVRLREDFVGFDGDGDAFSWGYDCQHGG